MMFPFSSLSRGTPFPSFSSISSASCKAAFMSFPRLISPIKGMKRSPPKIVEKTSSGSTKPPSGVLSFEPNSLYFLRRTGSDSVWYAIAIFLNLSSASGSSLFLSG